MMKTFGRIGWICMVTIVAGLVVTATLMFVSCGNSQKNKVQSGKQVQEPVGAVVEESEVVVEVDSITPDSTTLNAKR